MKKIISLIAVVFLFLLNISVKAQFGKLKDKLISTVKTGKDDGKNSFWKSGDKNYVEPKLFTSDLYKNNIGKLVFSKSKIDPNGSASQLSSTFNVGDEIYGCAFLETSMPNYKMYEYEDVNHKGFAPVTLQEDVAKTYFVSAFIDDEAHFLSEGAVNTKGHYYLNQQNISDQEKSQVYLNFIVNKGTNGKFISDEFITAMNNLSEGNHKIQFKVWAMNWHYYSKKPIATGEIIINKTKDSKVKTGNSFSKIESKMSNPNLEMKIIKYLNDDKLTNSASKGNTYLKLKLVSDDWIIVRNESTGVIVGRTIDVAVSIIEDNGNCKIELYAFREDYTGSGYQEKPYYVRRAFLEKEHPDIKIGPADCE